MRSDLAWRFKSCASLRFARVIRDFSCVKGNTRLAFFRGVPSGFKQDLTPVATVRLVCCVVSDSSGVFKNCCYSAWSIALTARQATCQHVLRGRPPAVKPPAIRRRAHLRLQPRRRRQLTLPLPLLAFQLLLLNHRIPVRRLNPLQGLVKNRRRHLRPLTVRRVPHLRLRLVKTIPVNRLCCLR